MGSRYLWPWLLVLLGLAPVGAQQKPVNMLCSPDLAWCEALVPAFKQATGLDLRFVRLSSGEALARLRAEAQRPQFDVWFGGTGDPHMIAFREGLTEFYKPRSWNQLRPELRAAVGETYIPLYMGAIGFVVNHQVLERRGLPEPKRWTDLADDRYRRLLAMPDPNTSGTGYTILATLVQLYGEDRAFQLLSRIHRNVAQYTRSGAAPGQLAGRGDVAIAVQFAHDGVKFALEGYPLKVLFPLEGTGYEIGGLSLVKGAPNREGAIRFIEWALTPEVQALAAKVGSFQIPSHTKTPVPPQAPRPANLIRYDFNTFGTPEVRERLLNRFNKEILPLPR
ncbi:ABC transporter substrate-binding protein [Thermus altitudinis]|uniref:ABC transporter substrate-binding protein n=1 Tax=Thermus altitudinis TaxID=2908145 RepID=UPI001FAAA11E|nr:ABC transporter substrate-binding protein [Thermus altitudinis]